ncbi:MAG: hypothetical protein ABI606_08430 [Rhodoferax sp.]
MRVNQLRSVWRRKHIYATDSKRAMSVAANVLRGLLLTVQLEISAT